MWHVQKMPVWQSKRAAPDVVGPVNGITLMGKDHTVDEGILPLDGCIKNVPPNGQTIVSMKASPLLIGSDTLP
jgi:hypothetical protein